MCWSSMRCKVAVRTAGPRSRSYLLRPENMSVANEHTNRSKLKDVDCLQRCIPTELGTVGVKRYAASWIFDRDGDCAVGCAGADSAEHRP